MMKITVRNYTSDDAEQLYRIFYDTVHTVNARDYSHAQLRAWAQESFDLDGWKNSFRGKRALVAESGGEIVGFADLEINIMCSMCADAYLDRLYVHCEHQRNGVARALLCRLEKIALEGAAKRISTYASTTAKPFFEAMGYDTVCDNTVERNGVRMTNFLMQKQL